MFCYVLLNVPLLLFIILPFTAKLPYSQLVTWQKCLRPRCLQPRKLMVKILNVILTPHGDPLWFAAASKGLRAHWKCHLELTWVEYTSSHSTQYLGTVLSAFPHNKSMKFESLSQSCSGGN